MQIITDYMELIIIALTLFIVIQAMIIGITKRKLKKLTLSYKAMMDGVGVENLESVIIQIKEDQKKHEQSIQSVHSKVEALEKRIPLQKSNVAIHRYNAFSDSGSDLSFSVAITNDEKDGVVLTSIYSREGMYVYGKPLTKGESTYSLTPEERKVIDEAK